MRLVLTCTPYIDTFGSKHYKAFLQRPFDPTMLANPKDRSTELFSGWQLKDRGSYQVYTNTTSTAYQIEVYGVGYKIFGENTSLEFPVHPKNIDQFITDCQRCDLPLIWKEAAMTSLHYSEYMPPKIVEEYNNFLLERLGKSEIPS